MYPWIYIHTYIQILGFNDFKQFQNKLNTYHKVLLFHKCVINFKPIFAHLVLCCWKSYYCVTKLSCSLIIYILQFSRIIKKRKVYVKCLIIVKEEENKGVERQSNLPSLRIHQSSTDEKKLKKFLFLKCILLCYFSKILQSEINPYTKQVIIQIDMQYNCSVK